MQTVSFQTVRLSVTICSVMASGVFVTLLLCWWRCISVVCAGHALHASWTHIDQLRQSETKIVSQMKTIIESLSDLSVALQR